MMNRVELETRLLQKIRGLPNDKLIELYDFADFLKSRLPTPNTPRKLSFVEFIRCSPLYKLEELEFERDQSVCRSIEL
jgi:hypothetical protein